MTFGSKLLEYRKSHKLSALELAKACGVSRSYITLMENGKRLPGEKVIPKLAMALNVKADVVLNWYLEEVRERMQKNLHI